MPNTLAVAPWRLFTADVRAVRRLSPTFRRITLTGTDLDRFADNGYDQRIKLVFPLPGVGLTRLPTGPDFFARWRAQPEATRNPIRTYTARAVRPHLRELDIDFVLHGDGGPASRWAAHARPGDALAVLGPDAGHDGDHGGVEFRPPAGAPLLLAGDETAVPAVGAILQRLPATARGRVFLEVPHPDDALPLAVPPGVRITWLPRRGLPRGADLVPAVRAAALALRPPVPAPATAALPDVDVDTETLWEIPPAAAAAPLYAWLAGEAAVIRTLRRILVTELGLDRNAVAFMGYWRLGRPDRD